MEIRSKAPNDIQALMKEMMRQVLQDGLEAELDDELGYTRYDYINKESYLHKILYTPIISTRAVRVYSIESPSSLVNQCTSSSVNKQISVAVSPFIFIIYKYFSSLISKSLSST